MTHEEFKAKIAAINADFELQLAAHFARMESVYAETSESLDKLETICANMENCEEIAKAHSV